VKERSYKDRRAREVFQLQIYIPRRRSPDHAPLFNALCNAGRAARPLVFIAREPTATRKDSQRRRSVLAANIQFSRRKFECIVAHAARVPVTRRTKLESLTGRCPALLAEAGRVAQCVSRPSSIPDKAIALPLDRVRRLRPPTWRRRPRYILETGEQAVSEGKKRRRSPPSPTIGSAKATSDPNLARQMVRS